MDVRELNRGVLEFETDPALLSLEHGLTEDQGWALAFLREFPDKVRENPILFLHIIQSLVRGQTDFEEFPYIDSTDLALTLKSMPRLDWSLPVQQAVREILREDGVVRPFPPFDFLPEEDFPEDPDPDVVAAQGKYFQILMSTPAKDLTE